MPQPLTSLLKKGCKWGWSEACTKAFKEAKLRLTSSPVLVHYNPDLPMHMAADASAYGVGAVISHVYPNDDEKPIAFSSRTLSQAEWNYFVTDPVPGRVQLGTNWEALGLIYGIQKFHQYLYGRKFTLVTDHKPITTIFGPKRGIPALAVARLQR